MEETNSKTVAVIVAHPDDEKLWAGGTILSHPFWNFSKISADELRTFAYEDGQKEYLPVPVKNAPVYRSLTKRIWLRKYSIITETYGFEKDSWEARTTPRQEAFWQFTNPFLAKKWLNNGGLYL
jgi:hypothetical protein